MEAGIMNKINFWNWKIMKTILVDAWNTFVTESWMNQDLYKFLEKYENPKIIVTNANEEQKKKLGIVGMPYPVFSLAHKPDKVDPVYFWNLIEKFWLNSRNIVYFEHNIDAVNSAKMLGIETFHYQKWEDNISELKIFFEKNL